MDKSDSTTSSEKEITPYGVVIPEAIWIWEAMRLFAQKESERGQPVSGKDVIAQHLIYYKLSTPGFSIFTIDGLDGEKLPIGDGFFRSGKAIECFLRGNIPYGNEGFSRGRSGRYLYVDRNQFNDFLEGKPVEEEPSTKVEQRVNTQYFPPYIQFMIQAVNALELTPEKRTSKSVIIDWLRQNWPADLEGKSDRMIESMATMLRRPEDKKGGNTPWE